MITVSVRELKNHMSHYLARAEQGEQVTITRRGKAIGVLLSPEKAQARKKTLQGLVAEGFLLQAGSKWTALPEPIRLKGKPLSEYVIEGRD